MGKNELVVRNTSTAVAAIKDPVFKEEPVVEFSLVDLSKYAFDYQWECNRIKHVAVGCVLTATD